MTGAARDPILNGKCLFFQEITSKVAGVQTAALVHTLAAAERRNGKLPTTMVQGSALPSIGVRWDAL